MVVEGAEPKEEEEVMALLSFAGAATRVRPARIPPLLLVAQNRTTWSGLVNAWGCLLARRHAQAPGGRFGSRVDVGLGDVIRGMWERWVVPVRTSVFSADGLCHNSMLLTLKPGQEHANAPRRRPSDGDGAINAHCGEST